MPLHEGDQHSDDQRNEQLAYSHDLEVQVDETRIVNLEAEIEVLKLKLHASVLRLSIICNSNSKIQFCTGFHKYSTLMALYKLLHPAVNSLNYWGSENKGDSKSIYGRHYSLPPTKEFLSF